MNRLAKKQTAKSSNSLAYNAGKQELKHNFIEFRAKGWSLRKAAKRLDISKSAAGNWQAAAGVNAFFEGSTLSFSVRIKRRS